MDSEVLQETRTLLNSLNEENTDLKVHVEHLTQQWRQSTSELESERRRFSQLEYDSKQINANLIRQLQSKGEENKTNQSAYDSLERRCQSMELQLERLAEEKAAAEDRTNAIQHRLQEAVSREEQERNEKLEARATADRYSNQLNEALQAQREKSLSTEKSLAQRCDDLTVELRKQQDLVATVQKQKESASNEYEKRIEKLQSKLDRIQEDASRTQHAEAECGFAHDEIQATSEAFYETLSDLHARNRAAQIDSAEVQNSISKITAKFRSIAQAATIQRKNSEELVNYYVAAYDNLKKMLAQAAAENSQLRTSMTSKVETVVAMTEKTAREATIRQEIHHQEQLAAAVSELETKQRERDALSREVERVKDALRDSHDTEKQLRAFSEQLYADVVAANKVASEASEKERLAKSHLSTAEHRVAEQVRREMTAAYESERSRLTTEMSTMKTQYELEISELRAQIEENADSMRQALSRMNQHQNQQQPQRNNPNNNNFDDNNRRSASSFTSSSQQQQQQPQNFQSSGSRSSSAPISSFQQQQQQQNGSQNQHLYFQPTMTQGVDFDQPSSSSHYSASPPQQQQQQQQQQPQSSSSSRPNSDSAYRRTMQATTLSPAQSSSSQQQHSNPRSGSNNYNGNKLRSGSTSRRRRQQQQHQNEEEDDDNELDYGNNNNNQAVGSNEEDEDSFYESERKMKQRKMKQQQQQKQQQPTYNYDSLSPVRSAATLPRPAQNPHYQQQQQQQKPRYEPPINSFAVNNNTDNNNNNSNNEVSVNSPSNLRWTNYDGPSSNNY